MLRDRLRPCQSLSLPGAAANSGLTPQQALYLLAKDGADGLLHLGRVLDVHSPHVRLADVDLGVGVLRGELHRK